MIDVKKVHGAIVNEHSGRKDSLIRVSLKAVILDDEGRILVVKERGRDWWDIPGGGLDHGETVKEALARELLEEVSLRGDFEYEAILAEDPRYLENHNFYQMRITFVVRPAIMTFGPGAEGDEVQLIDPSVYEKSNLVTERKIFAYSELAKSRRV